MAESIIKNSNYTYESIATTGSGTSVTYSVDESKYRFLFMTMGAGTAVYASGIFPVCMKNAKNNLQLFVFGASGQYVARGNLNINTKTLTTTDASYPAMLYGII